jgi:hypothetical protein
MPLASSTDLVIAGINDIIQALMHLSTNSPLAPQTDSKVQALRDLTTLLSNISAPPKFAPSLRVEPTDTIVLPLKAPPCAPPLRVEPPPGFAPLPVPPPTPTPEPPFVATYDNSTGVRGRKHCKQTRKPKETATPKPPPTHSHGTQGNQKKQQHSAANADTTWVHSDTYRNAGFNKKKQTPDTDTAAAASFHSDAYHCALHSTTINPDTGHTAKYRELCVCTDSDKGINSCADEIGRLCNGWTNANGKVIAGANTLFFIPIAAMPKDRKATYIRIVCADCPEKEEQRRVHLWSAETKSTTPAPSAPKLPT